MIGSSATMRAYLVSDSSISNRTRAFTAMSWMLVGGASVISCAMVRRAAERQFRDEATWRIVLGLPLDQAHCSRSHPKMCRRGPRMDTEREQRIRERAYELWEQAGRPDGGAEEFWRQAEREIEEQEDKARPMPLPDPNPDQ